MQKEMYKKALEVFENTNSESVINHELVKEVMKKRDSSVYKGSCGTLTVCAGSVGMTGAACLATEAALRSGCGLVTLCCAKELNDIFEIKLTEAMTKPVVSKDGVIHSDAFDDIFEKAQKDDALLYGPGLSWDSQIKKLAQKLLTHYKKPMVIDADGLNVISENTDILKNTQAKLVLTPHVGEFSRLTGYDKEYILKNYKELAMKFAADYGVVLVLKSHKTVVTDGKKLYENILGNPGMAVGGCGDVLSGVIAAFLSQGNSPLMSALAGVYIHSLAADMAVMETGEYSLLPRDITDYLKYAIRETSLRA